MFSIALSKADTWLIRYLKQGSAPSDECVGDNDLKSEEHENEVLESFLDFTFKLRKHSCHSPSDIWRNCISLKSPDPALLETFWQFFFADKQLAKSLANFLLLEYSDTHNISEQGLPDCLMMMELMLIQGKYEQCTRIGDILTVKYHSDLRLQDIRARALLLMKTNLDLEKDLTLAYKPFHQYFCSSTFDTIAFFEKEVFICCCNFLPTSVGSIGYSNADDLWDSPIAQSIRKTILDGSFQYCNKMTCPRLRNMDLPLRNEASLSQYYKNIIANRVITFPGCYPRSIELNEDPSCNLTCPSCRAGHEFGNQNFLANLEENMIPGIFKNRVNSFLVACYGEPFASRHYLKILQGLDSSIHKIDRLIIFTNGLLLTRSMWENLNNLHSYAIEIRISIDATTEEVYQSLRRGGTWNKLQSNLEFFGQLRRDKKIVKLMFSFVIQKDNYSFMPEFVRMAKKFNVDEVVFSELQKYGEYNQNDALYMEKAVHLKEHPDNEHFKSLLLHPILKDPIVSYHGCKL